MLPLRYTSVVLTVITFKQFFNESVLFNCYAFALTTAMTTYTFLIYSVLCTPQAYSSSTVQLASAGCMQLI